MDANKPKNIRLRTIHSFCRSKKFVARPARRTKSSRTRIPKTQDPRLCRLRMQTW